MTDREQPREGIPDPEGPLPDREQGEGQVPPADRSEGVDEHGTTADEQRRGQPLDERLGRERPDAPPPRERREEAGQLADEGAPDEEKDAVAEEAGEKRGLGAEEAAVRVEEEPPGGSDEPRDGYLEEP